MSETATTHKALTMRDVIALDHIGRAAQQCAVVLRYLETTGSVVRGTARHIVHSPENIGFLGGDDDVRDGYLRVTLDTGFEAFWPISELMEDSRNGAFALESE